MSSSSLCLLPTEHLAVLDVADNDLGLRFSNRVCPTKRSFDECLHLTASGANTKLQACPHDSPMPFCDSGIET